MAVLIDSFDKMGADDLGEDLLNARDQMRLSLRQLHPGDYVAGTMGVDIVSLSLHLLGRPVRSTDAITACSSCQHGWSIQGLGFAQLQPFNIITDEEQSVQSAVDERLKCTVPCPRCSQPAMLQHPFTEFLCFQVVDQTDILINSRIECGAWGTYHLAGVVYFGGRHFTARVIAMDNKIYMHVGVDGPYSVYDGILDLTFPGPQLNRCQGWTASLAIYVRSSVRQFRGRRPT
jgi:hypothetical protein